MPVETVGAVQSEWQQTCRDGLVVSVDMGGEAGQEHWSALRQKWISEKKERVTLVDLDLGGADLRGYDFTRCWIGRSSFVSANLSGARFDQAIFRECDLTGVNIRGASFYAADLNYPKNRLVGTQFDNSTNMEVNPGQLAPEMDQALIDMAQGAWRRTDWQRKRASSWPYKLLTFVTDYGFGFRRVALAAVLVIMLFGLLFRAADSTTTAANSFLISTRYFLALEDHYSGVNAWLSVAGIVEATIGLLFLAVVVAIFTSKFTDL